MTLNELKEHIAEYLEIEGSVDRDTLFADVSEWATDEEIQQALDSLILENVIFYDMEIDIFSVVE